MFFSYSVGEIGSIFNESFKTNWEIGQKLDIIKKYMNDKQISVDLQNQILEYLEFYWRENDEKKITEEKEIISLLNDNLRVNLFL